MFELSNNFCLDNILLWVLIFEFNWTQYVAVIWALLFSLILARPYEEVGVEVLLRPTPGKCPTTAIWRGRGRSPSQADTWQVSYNCHMKSGCAQHIPKQTKLTWQAQIYACTSCLCTYFDPASPPLNSFLLYYYYYYYYYYLLFIKISLAEAIWKWEI